MVFLSFATGSALFGPLFLGGSALLLTAGCSNIRHTDTPRSAKEQLMLSASVERAWSQLDVRPFRGKAVFIESQFLECLDKGHALSALRERLCVNGVELAEKPDSAELILEVRCAALGTDRQHDRIGTPALPIVGTNLAVPEINFAEATSQAGGRTICRVRAIPPGRSTCL